MTKKTTNSEATTEVPVSATKEPLANSFSSKFTLEQREAMKASDARLIDTSHIQRGTVDWHAKHGEHTHGALQGAGGIDGAAQRPRTLNTYAQEHVDFMLSAGRAHMAGLGPNADAATMAEYVTSSLDQWADQLAGGVPANDQPHLYSRGFTVPTGNVDSNGVPVTARVTVKMGKDISVSDEDATNAYIDAQRDRLLSMDLASAGRSERKAIEIMSAALAATKGFDPRTGDVLMEVSGKARLMLERRLADTQRSLHIVQIEASLAHKLQAEHAEDTAAAEEQFEASVNSRASEMVIEAEAKKRATVMAARRGR